MDLPFCKICGERHRLGFCPEYGPIPDPVRASIIERPHAEKIQAVNRPPEAPAARQVVVPPIQRGAIFPVAKIFDPEAGRPFAPEDMKQETMPVTKPRFDRNAYQRDLMRKRRANKWVSVS